MRMPTFRMSLSHQLNYFGSAIVDTDIQCALMVTLNSIQLTTTHMDQSQEVIKMMNFSNDV